MILSLCGFVVYYEAFHVQSYVPPCSHLLSVLFSIVITLLGEERAGTCIYASRAFVFILHASRFVFLSSTGDMVSRVGCGLWLWHSLDFSF